MPPPITRDAERAGIAPPDDASALLGGQITVQHRAVTAPGRWLHVAAAVTGNIRPAAAAPPAEATACVVDGALPGIDQYNPVAAFGNLCLFRQAGVAPEPGIQRWTFGARKITTMRSPRWAVMLPAGGGRISLH